MARKRIHKSDPIDIRVGRNIAQLRAFKGLSQKVLADTVGVSYQQIQKYEQGTNRIAASMLFRIARAFETSEQRLFEGVHKELRLNLPYLYREDIATLREFIEIPNDALKNQLRGLISLCSKFEKVQDNVKS